MEGDTESVDPATSVPVLPVKKTFKCTYEGCDAVYAASAKLTKHMCTHTGIKAYVCEHPACGASFMKSAQLTKHRQSHSEHPQTERTAMSNHHSHTGEKHFNEIEKSISDGNVNKLGNLLTDSHSLKNTVILACRLNNVKILEFLLGKKIIKLSIPDQTLLLDDQDEMGHNAFYYAVRSGSVELLETLIDKWPSKYFATHCEALDEILSQAYEELKLKNVPLSGEMTSFVENKLIHLRFFSNAPAQHQNGNVDIKNIKERIDIVIQNIYLLHTQHSTNKIIDSKFLYITTFIAQNIHILKRFLKFSYDRLPWEEIEFCLISFVSSYTKRQEINLFSNSTLNSSKIVKYLLHFATGLQALKKVIGEIDNRKLSNIPCFKRDEIVEDIVKQYPQYIDLYRDYQQVRDNYSLMKIRNYIDLAVSVDAKQKEGQLIITRVLQVIGEYLKNTLESPKLSTTTSELLLLSLPKNTRQVLIDLRNSLSHAFSLAMRTEIEEKRNINFFVGVQNDSQKINSVISEISVRNKIKLVRSLLQKVISSKNFEDFREVLEMVKNLKVDDVMSENLNISQFDKLEKNIEELSNIISDKTSLEKKLFKQLEEQLNSIKTHSDTSIDFVLAASTLIGFKDSHVDDNSLRVFKFAASKAMENLPKPIESDILTGIADKMFQIYRCVSSRKQLVNLDKIKRLIYEIIFFVEVESGDLKWIGAFGGKLSEFIPWKKQKYSTDKRPKSYKYLLEAKLQDLKDILNQSGSDDFSAFKDSKNLQATVEMLVLDIMSILGIGEKHLENNLLFLDENTPILTGKSLRNHLAHDNILVYLLSADPSAVVYFNAKKLISDIVLKSPKKIGQFVRDDSSKLKNKYAHNLITVTTQENMFSSLEAGDFEEFMKTLNNGADLNARSLNSSTALHFAARGPCIEAVKFLINEKLCVNDKDENGQSPLHIAAACGRNNILEYLIKETGLDVNLKDKKWKTPLHSAASNGHRETVNILLKYNAGTNSKDMAGFSPIHCAIQNNHIKITKILMKKEKNVDLNEAMGGFAPLHIAAEKGYLDLVHFLLENNGNVNAKTDRGAASLHTAALNGHLQVVKALILAGADVKAQALDGGTALHNAVETGREEIVNILIEHGANVDAVDKTYLYTPLHFAAEDGRERILNILLMNNSNANATTVEGLTPLHLAVKRSHEKVVALLLKHGVNVHSTDKYNNTPLHLAAFSDNKTIVELLIKNKADINNKSNNNLTPLHIVAEQGNKDITQLLITNKADIRAKDIFGRTPLHAAARHGNLEVIRLLFNAKSEVDVRSNEGMTPLHEAASQGHENAVMLLIEHNADINAKSNAGVTPFHSAVMGGHTDIVNLLIKNKVKIDKDKNTELFLAAEAGHIEIVKLLIEYGVCFNKGKDSLSLCSAIKRNNKELVKLLINHGANVNENDGKPLFTAVLAGYSDIVEVLLEHNARIDNKNGDCAPLIVAATKGYTRVVNALIEKGANVNMKISNNITPLILASQKGHDDIVKILLSHGANVNSTDNEGSTPLHLSAPFGHDNVIDVLLAYGAKINIKDNKNRTALELAVAHGQLKVVRMLVPHKDTKKNIIGNDGFTLLHIATENKHLEVVKYLVNEGCDINAKNSYGSKPIHIAARDGCCDIIKFFLSKGLSVDDRGHVNQTLLHYATSKGQLEVVKFLIEHGVDVNAIDDLGETPMHFAALVGSKDVVDVLLKTGAVYNSKDKLHRTPLTLTSNRDLSNSLMATEDLFESVKNNNIADVKKFIKAGAFIYARNASSGTPLHFAAWKGNDEIVKILLDNKANPNAVGNKGFTALHYAAKFGHFKIVKCLLKHGSVYNYASESGKTPLDLTEDSDIANLLKLINESFKKVVSKKEQVISDLNKIKDIETMAAIMGAQNKEKQNLVTSALLCNFSKVEQLMEVMQGNVSQVVDQAMLLCSQGAHRESLKIFKSLFEKRKTILGPDNPGTLDLQSNIALVLYKQGTYHEALDILNEICKKQTDILGLNHKYTLKTRSTIALVFYRLNRADEAYGIFKEVYQKQKEILGASDSETLNTQFHMALVLDRLGKYDEALKINKEVFELRKNTLGPYNPATVSAQNNVALVLMNQDKCAEALQMYQEVFEKKKMLLGFSHADTLRTMHNIGGIHMKQNNNREAMKIFNEVLSIQKQQLPQNHPEILNTRYNIGNAYFNEGKYFSALKSFSEVYDLRKTFFGPFEQTVLDIENKIEIINLRLKSDGSNVSEVLMHLQNDINNAANDGDVEKLKLLLEGGVDVNEADVEGRTPLHFAVSNKHFDIVKMLVNNGACVTHATNKGNTPLHTATAKENTEFMLILLQNVNREKLNDFVNAKTSASGATCLHVAAKAGFVEGVQILLRFGAIYCVENKEGKKPIDVCQDFQIKKLLKFLEILFDDVKDGNAQIINKLKAKPDEMLFLSNARNSQGKTLLQVGITCKHSNIIGPLLKLFKESSN